MDTLSITEKQRMSGEMEAFTKSWTREASLVKREA